MSRTHINPDSDDWCLLAEQLRAWIAEDDKRLRLHQDHEKTSALRTRIETLEKVLALPFDSRPDVVSPLGFESY